MEAALLNEIKDNVEYANRYSSGYLKGTIKFQRGIQKELDTFVWTTMKNTGNSFQIETAILTETRRFYSGITRNLFLLTEVRSVHGAEAAKEIVKISKNAHLNLIPEMEKMVLEKKLSLKSRGLID